MTFVEVEICPDNHRCENGSKCVEKGEKGQRVRNVCEYYQLSSFGKSYEYLLILLNRKR